MPDKLMTMIESASVMLLPVLLITLIQGRFDARPRLRAALLGVVFAMIGAVVMDNAVEIVPGIRTDPRAAVIVLAFLFGGPLTGAITTLALVAIRLDQGGAGTQPGVIYIAAMALAACGYVLWMRRDGRDAPAFRDVVAAAVLAAFVPGIVLLFVSVAPWSVYLTSMGLAMPTNFGAVLAVGMLLVRDRERGAAIAAEIEKRAQIDAIADNSPTVIFQAVPHRDGCPRVSFASCAARRILGVEASALMARDDGLCALFPGEIGRVEQAFGTHAGSISLELPYAHPEGPRWLRIDAGARIDARGAKVWDGTMIDITAQRTAEEMKDNFISVISHELRTPLTSIRGSLGLALGGPLGTLPGPVEKMLRIADRNAGRLVRLVNEILDSQKLRAGQMDFSLAPELVGTVVEAAIAELEDFAPEKGVETGYDDRTGGALIRVDAGRLGLVVQNLLSNAYKFAPHGGTVRVFSEVVEGELRLSVSDDGPGIPEAFRPHVFDRFRQAQGAHDRNTPGTGLGLSTARALVEGMGGRIWFDTAEGQGTTFHVAFPVIAGAAPAEVEWFDGPRPLPHLLYVEDDASLQEVIGARIGARARVTAAPTLAEARAVLERDGVDVLLLDLDLPDGMATDFLNRVPPDVPVIVFSAFEVDPAQMRRAARIMIKSRVPESEVVETVLEALESVGPGPGRAAA